MVPQFCNILKKHMTCRTFNFDHSGFVNIANFLQFRHLCLSCILPSNFCFKCELLNVEKQSFISPKMIIKVELAHKLQYAQVNSKNIQILWYTHQNNTLNSRLSYLADMENAQVIANT